MSGGNTKRGERESEGRKELVEREEVGSAGFRENGRRDCVREGVVLREKEMSNNDDMMTDQARTHKKLKDNAIILLGTYCNDISSAVVPILQ